MQSKLFDVEMSLRGILRGFGQQGRADHAEAFCGPDQRAGLWPSDPGGHRRGVAGGACGAAGAATGFEKRVRTMARDDERVRLLMSTPGVGAIVALTYVSAVDDPRRFTSSKAVGAHFGLTPKKYQSGQTDVTGRISKTGDAEVRTALYEAAHIILTCPVKGGALKSWGARLAKRAGMKKAKVALARKLAVVLHRMWVDGTRFNLTMPRAPVAMAA